jgi:hypothetical protein
MNDTLTEWDQLIDLFQNEPEVHLDIEIDPGTHSQAFRLHNGQDGEGWQEFYSGTLDTTLEDHKGGVIYADEVAAVCCQSRAGSARTWRALPNTKT